MQEFRQTVTILYKEYMSPEGRVRAGGVRINRKDSSVAVQMRNQSLNFRLKGSELVSEPVPWEVRVKGWRAAGGSRTEMSPVALGAVGGTSDLRLKSLAGDVMRGRGRVLIFGSTLGNLRQWLRSEARIPSVRKLEPGKREWVARCVDKVPVQEWAGRSDLGPRCF